MEEIGGCRHYHWKKTYQYRGITLITLLENEPSEPVEEGLRHRFYNRYPQTETIGLSLGHRVFHPVP